MKKTLLFSCLLLFSTLCFAQESLTWKRIMNISWERKFNKQYNEYINYPKFSEDVKSLNGKEVTIKGYVMPVEVNGDYMVISAFPYENCFFCGGAGPESVMEVYLKDKKPVYSTQVKVKGTLQLNADDVDHLVFLLKDAVVVN